MTLETGMATFTAMGVRRRRKRRSQRIAPVAFPRIDGSFIAAATVMMIAYYPVITASKNGQGPNTAYIISSSRVAAEWHLRRQTRTTSTSILSSSAGSQHRPTLSTEPTARKSSCPRHSIMPDDISSQQHERLASAPSWGKAEDIRPPSALESALWKFPSLALHAHAGLVNLTGSVAGGVVSGFRDVISPAALASAATITGTVGQVMGTAPMPKGGWGGGSEIQTDEGVEDLSDLYGQDEDNFLQDTDSEDSYAPAHRYDDSAELVVWADGGVYPPPTEPESEAREDSPAMSQLQRDVARILGWTTSSSPRAREQALQDQAGRGAEGGPGESQAVGSDVQGGKGRQAVERDRETIAQVRRIAAGLLGRFLRVGFLTYRLVVAGAVGILRSPYQRCLRLLHVLGAAFEGMLVSVVLLGTTASNSMRRILRAPVRGLPSPNVCQRLATSFTRFLHAHCPGLLAHPIFYGGPFPWQWKLGRSILRRSSSSADGAAGLPPLAVLLRDLGGAVVSSQGQAGRRRPRDKRQERSQPHLHRHTPLWSLPQHVKDDWSKSTLQIDASSREWADMPVPPPPSPRLDLISPVEENKLPLAVVQEKGDRSLRKEVRTALKRHEEERAATPSGPPRPTGGSSPSSPTAAKATGSGRNEATATATDPARQEETSSYKGPELFTSYFPLELEDFIAEDVARMGSTAGYGVAASTAAQVGGTSAKEESSRSVSGEEAHVSLGAEKHARTGPSEKTSVSTANRHVSVDLPANPPFPASTSDGNFDKSKLKELAQKESEADAVRAAGDSAYGRILADLNTQPMPVTEEVEDAPPGLNFALPYAASIPSLERMDQRMVALAVESALTVQSKSQLWRYIEEIGISPLLAAIKKDFENDGGGSVEEADMDDSSHGDSNIASPYSLFPSSVSPVAPSPAFPALDDRQAGDTHVLRVEAVEAILHLMEVARDLRVLRAAFEEGPGLAPVVGVEVVADLIDLIEEPLLLLMPRIIRPRNDELLYRGQRAAVEVLFQLVLASDKAISLAQKDGRLWNALQQMTADGMYAAGSPTFATCHKLLAALGHNEWRPRQPGQRGLRILSFDGGGTRGVLSVALLKQVMKRVGKDVFETFDVICGTSTGGILAVLFGIERRTVDEAEALYDKLVSKIFASSPLIQTTKLLLRTSYYDEVVWEQVLQDMLGDNLMIDSMGEGPLSPKVFCASLSLKTNPASLYIWRNYAYGPDHEPKHSGSFRVMVRDALRATTAAPTFFSPLEREDAKYCDGAFLANNPTAVALNEVRTLYPGVPVECVVSIGTGVHVDNRKADGGYGWEGIVNDLINCATNTEVTHQTLSAFLPKSKYYRFNPQTEFFPLDETKPERLARMKSIAREYFWQSDNKERMNELVHLLKKGTSPLPHLRSSLRP